MKDTLNNMRQKEQQLRTVAAQLVRALCSTRMPLHCRHCVWYRPGGAAPHDRNASRKRAGSPRCSRRSSSASRTGNGRGALAEISGDRHHDLLSGVEFPAADSGGTSSTTAC